MELTAVIYLSKLSVWLKMFLYELTRTTSMHRLSPAFGSCEGHTFVACIPQRVQSLIWDTAIISSAAPVFTQCDWVWIYLLNSRSDQHTASTDYGYNELNWMYLRGLFLGRSRCVPHRDGQPAAGRLKRRSWAGQKDLKAVSPQTERKGTHWTLLAQQDFLF